VGCWRDLAQTERDGTIDLGDAIVLPGLVNAHCHLDYTDMAGQFPPPKIFSDWLKLITTAKGHWSKPDYATSWINGAQMLLRTGTTTVGDIEAMPDLLPEVWNLGGLRVMSFLEMIGITGRREPGEIVQEALGKIDSLRAGRCCAGLSPHAPYSTLPQLLTLSANAARQRGLRMCVHVAESRQEFEMFVHARGEMYDWLRRSTRDMSDCGLGSPVRASTALRSVGGESPGSTRKSRRPQAMQACLPNERFTLFTVRAVMNISATAAFRSDAS